MNNHVYILEADPTRYGGIQEFCRNLGQYLPEKSTLLAYYGNLAYDKQVSSPLVKLNHAGFIKKAYFSQSNFWRIFSLLANLWQIRRNLARQLQDGDTLVLNSASAMLLFCLKSESIGSFLFSTIVQL